MQRYAREVSIALAIGLLLLLMAAVAPAFFRPEHLRDKLVANVPVLVVAIGMTLIIVAKQIDISVGSQFSVCGVLAALAAQHDWPLVAVFLVAVGSGACMGAVNGWFVAQLKLPAIVVTLATMVIYRESLRWWREGEFVRGLQDRLQWFGAEQTAGQWIIVSVAVTVLVGVSLTLRYLPVGRSVYAVGSNIEAARLVGVRPERVLFGSFMLVGALTGLAALLGAARFGDVDPGAGGGMELQVIAAVVIGGCSISGGRGNLLGTILGVVLLGLIGPALVFLHIQPQWEKALQGIIILLAVALEPHGANRGWRLQSYVPSQTSKPQGIR